MQLSLYRMLGPFAQMEAAGNCLVFVTSDRVHYMPQNVLSSPSASHSFTASAMAKYVSMGIEEMRTHEERNPEPVLPIEWGPPREPIEEWRREMELVRAAARPAQEAETQEWMKLRVHFPKSALRDFNAESA